MIESSNEENEIKEIPDFPESLRKKLENNKEQLAIFIGAGVSRIGGCDSWEKLASRLVEKTRNNPLNFSEVEQLKQIKDYKKQISICKNILDVTDFFDEMKKALKEKVKKSDKNNCKEKKFNDDIYQQILRFRGPFITTNADTHFDKINNSKYEFRKFNKKEIESDYIYHIHGSIEEPTTMVFTVKRYIERYNEPEFKDFLKDIFENYTVLFIGYGLTEFEILDYIFPDPNNKDEKKEEKEEENKETNPKHYMLKAYYSFEKKKFDLEEEHYFKDYRIGLHPYQKDKEGYMRDHLRPPSTIASGIDNPPTS